jgi:hypothetical protein
MNRAFRLKIARQTAEKYLRDNGFHALPIKPREIAAILDIQVLPMPSHIDGVSGMLLRHGDSYGIAYSTHFENEGFENFSIGHEIGHFMLEGHLDQVVDIEGKHYSRAGFTSADPYEKEADQFASGLLMPEALFKSALRKRDACLDTIEAMATLCGTSLTATAIRCAELSEEALAAIISTDGVIDYCFMSDAMKSLPKLSFLRKGTPVPAATATAKLHKTQARVLASDRAVSEIDVIDWLGGTKSVAVMEEVVGLGRYGKVLTVLSSESIGLEEQGYDSEDQDDERLAESWRPKFRK